MSNENKKQVKTNDLFEDSFLSITRTFKKLFLADKITNTTAKICIELFDYFATESGRNLKYKNYTVTDLRKNFGKDGKLLSRSTLKIAIDQIKEHNLFLIESGFIGQEVTYSFHPRNYFSIGLFEAIQNGSYFSKFGTTFNVFKNDKVIQINALSKDKNDFTLSENESTVCENESVVSENEFTLSDEKNSFSENESTVCENESAVYEEVKSFINSDIQKSCEVLQESYTKESIFKETYIHREEKNISNDLNLEKVETNQEDVTYVFLNDGLEEEEIEEVKYDDLESEEKLLNDEIEQENNEPIETPKVNEKIEILPDEVDEVAIEKEKLKEILIYDYGFFNKDALEFVDKFSVKCIRESIDILIAKIDSGFICENEGKYLRGIINNWKEKKETVQETSRPAISPKNISMPGESDFIKLMYSKKVIHTSLMTLQDTIKNSLGFIIERKDLFLEIKEKFSKEQIQEFFLSFKNQRFMQSEVIRYTDYINTFWLIWNDIKEMDKYIQVCKELNEKARLEILSKFNNSIKKESIQETLVNDEKILSDLQDDLDSEDIPY